MLEKLPPTGQYQIDLTPFTKIGSLSYERIKELHAKEMYFPLDTDQVHFQFRCFELDLSPPRSIDPLFIQHEMTTPLTENQKDWIVRFFSQYPNNWKKSSIYEKWFWHKEVESLWERFQLTPDEIYDLPIKCIQDYHANFSKLGRMNFKTTLAFLRMFVRFRLDFDLAMLLRLRALPQITTKEAAENLDMYDIHLYHLFYQNYQNEWEFCPDEVKQVFLEYDSEFIS